LLSNESTFNSDNCPKLCGRGPTNDELQLGHRCLLFIPVKRLYPKTRMLKAVNWLKVGGGGLISTILIKLGV